MATNDNQEKQPADKIEEGIKESVPADMGYGWFKWNFVVYPSLLAFTMTLLVLQDVIKILDLALSIIILPFAAIYAVKTGKWIEQGVEDSDHVTYRDIDDQNPVLVDDRSDKPEGSIDVIDHANEDDHVIELDEDGYETEVDDDGFVEIEIK